MNFKQRLYEYLLITGVVWLFYASILPIYFYFAFNWGWSEVINWWVTGTPVEFILAYPLGKILQRVTPKITLWCNKQ